MDFFGLFQIDVIRYEILRQLPIDSIMKMATLSRQSRDIMSSDVIYSKLRGTKNRKELLLKITRSKEYIMHKIYWEHFSLEWILANIEAIIRCALFNKAFWIFSHFRSSGLFKKRKRSLISGPMWDDIDTSQFSKYTDLAKINWGRKYDDLIRQELNKNFRIEVIKWLDEVGRLGSIIQLNTISQGIRAGFYREMMSLLGQTTFKKDGREIKEAIHEYCVNFGKNHKSASEESNGPINSMMYDPKIELDIILKSGTKDQFVEFLNQDKLSSYYIAEQFIVSKRYELLNTKLSLCFGMMRKEYMATAKKSDKLAPLIELDEFEKITLLAKAVQSLNICMFFSILEILPANKTWPINRARLVVNNLIMMENKMNANLMFDHLVKKGVIPNNLASWRTVKLAMNHNNPHILNHVMGNVGKRSPSFHFRGDIVIKPGQLSIYDVIYKKSPETFNELWREIASDATMQGNISLLNWLKDKIGLSFIPKNLGFVRNMAVYNWWINIGKFEKMDMEAQRIYNFNQNAGTTLNSTNIEFYSILKARLYAKYIEQFGLDMPDNIKKLAEYKG